MKFRVWDEVIESMVYSKQMFKDYNIVETYNPVFDENGELSIVNVNRNNDELPMMAFTGYRDINDKEIYGGDIVRFDDIGEEGYEFREAYDIYNKAEVVFNGGRWELCNFGECDTGINNEMNGNADQEMWDKFMSEELEVVGNIFENKDLRVKYEYIYVD